ncbi:peptidyl-dipeptidase Dcp [Bogoriella caseilytica]|uniref:Peptidyl-dipeptidase Dcp n=2 Tax=Bogoriella caseilytica TaxID=56055 RepID=A0A3N2B8Z3_9MICO|nr:peptidyl-dipeptidase Dcp [Bogoriella caseilytica]
MTRHSEDLQAVPGMMASMSHSPADLDPANPLVAPSALPFGLPDFAAIDIAHLRPALEAGMAEQRAEWEAIATDDALPDVANTLEALERSGQLLTRASVLFRTLSSAVGGEEIDALEAEITPALTAHRDALWLDTRIFDRIESLVNAGPLLDLDGETERLLQEYRRNFVRAGVKLSPAETEELRALNGRLGDLQTEFRQRVVKGMSAAAVHVTEKERLAGLDEGTLAALAKAAADAGRSGGPEGAEAGWLISLRLPTQQPLLAQLEDAELRSELLSSSLNRGSGIDPETDTRGILLEIARVRAERARLLGYEHHAGYVAENSTAQQTSAINERMAMLAAPAARNAHAEAAELAAMLPEGAELSPADWSYYAERLRKERFEIDDAALRPYLELNRVLTDGVFWAAQQLYGLTMKERPDLRGYAEGVRVWEAREENGEALGLFVGDYFSRPGKRGGAWMNHLVDQSGLLGNQPVVVNNLNLTPPPEGEPALLTWDEVRTCFHEFGHALHGLFSDARYPTLSGTSVPRDFVEYPSQVNEMWMENPAVVGRFARHHSTGEPLPEELLRQVIEAAGYGEGFATCEYLGAAIIDQAWHQLAPEDVPSDPEEVTSFELAALARAGLDLDLVPPRYRSTYLNHSFGGGYDAGYYSYIWSEVLDADTVGWFTTEGQIAGDGGLNRMAGQRFRELLLSRGNTQDPLASFRELRGREPDTEPLLVRRGLTG